LQALAFWNYTGAGQAFERWRDAPQAQGSIAAKYASALPTKIKPVDMYLPVEDMRAFTKMVQK
jgi:hypothetical protein